MEEVSDLSSLKIYYYKFKDTPYFNLSISALLIVIGLIMLYVFIYPQAKNAFSIQRETTETRKSIEAMKDNESYLKSLPPGTVDGDFSLVTSALPSNKNFVLIYDAIVDTARKSSVTLEDFAFEVGDIDSPSSGNEETVVVVGLNLLATSDNTEQFIDNLYDAVPIAEITRWSTAGSSTSLDIKFYYDPVTNEIIDPTKKLEAYSSSEQKQLSSIRDYLNSKGSSQVVENVGTESGGFNLPPL